MLDGYQANMSTVDLLALRIRQLEKYPKDVALAIERLAQSRFQSKERFIKEFGYRIPKEYYPKGILILI